MKEYYQGLWSKKIKEKISKTKLSSVKKNKRNYWKGQ